jgi:hypothetical protein
MTKDEALDLALEALDIVKIHFTQNRHVNEAITAIKQALAAPVQKPSYWLGYGLQAHTEKPFEDATPVWTSPPAAQPAPVQSCYCPNCEAMGKELVALKAQQAPVQPVGTYGEIYESMQALLRSGLQRDQQIYMEMKDKPLYATPPAAQPAPVQPIIGSYLEKDNSQFKFSDYESDGMHHNKPAVPDAFGTREGEHPQYIEGWNDCRAEMLKGMK